MSKKDRKIKKLKRELKALKAELHELKSLRRWRTTVAEAKSPPKSPSRSSLKPQPKRKGPAKVPTLSPAPERLDVDTPPLMSMALRSISAVRSTGQH